MKFFGLVRSASATANRLTLIAAAFLGIKVFLLDRFVAPAPWLVDAGEIAEGVFESIIASYVFYLVVVHIKERSDAAIVGPFVLRYVRRIVGDCQAILAEIQKVSGVPLALESVDEALLSVALWKIVPASNAPLLFAESNRYGNWWEYLLFQSRRTKQSIDKLFAFIIYLDPETLSRISHIDDSAYLNTLDVLAKIGAQHTNLGSITSVFFGYCRDCQALQRHMQELEERMAWNGPIDDAERHP